MTADSSPAKDGKDEQSSPAGPEEGLLANGDQFDGPKPEIFRETSRLKFKREDIPFEKRASMAISLHSVHHFTVQHPTTYTETMINFIKANIGSGMFAMGDAMKNSGVVLGPILTTFLGVICVFCQHELINASALVADRFSMGYHPNFAETVELSFSVGPPILRRLSVTARKMSYALLCITQIGFCCVYFVFISSTVKQVADEFIGTYSVSAYMAAMLPPILLTSWIRSLKFLAPLSLIANILMSVAVALMLYLCAEGPLNPISERDMVSSWNRWPLFFGTVVYCFEGISMTMPIRNHMKKPRQFEMPMGILNVGTSFVASLLIITGIMGFWKFGEEVEGIMTLNLNKERLLTKIVQGSIALSILLTYAMQAYVPVEIIWGWVQEKYKPRRYRLLLEYVLRSALVLFTFSLAVVIPNLSLFISLIGAISSSSLAFIFPPLMDMSANWDKGQHFFRHMINISILSFASVVAVWGSYASMSEIVHAFTSTSSDNSTTVASNITDFVTTQAPISMR